MFYYIKCKCIKIFDHVYSHVGIRWTISMWGYDNKTIVFHTLKQNREGLKVVYCVPYVEPWFVKYHTVPVKFSPKK